MKKYIEIEKDIVNKILNGVLSEGQLLPSEEKLCERYKCSKITIKKAMNSLSSKGILFRLRGSGTVVSNNAKHWLSFNTQNILGHTRGNKERFKITTTVVSFEIVPCSKYIASMLGIEMNDYVFHFIRVRNQDDIPSVYEESYVPISIVPNLSPKNIESSIFEFIETETSQVISSIHKTISMVEAPSDVSDKLNIMEKEVTAFLEEVNYFQNGTAFKYSLIYQNYRDFNYYSVIQATNW